MSDFQNKVGGSLNKIQGSLQQGKQKIQTAQEISQIQQNINTLRQKRQELIVEMGAKMHKKLRLKEAETPDFEQISKNIEMIDKEVYGLSKSVESLKASSKDSYICTSCESEVNPSDKFCGSCGTPVIIQEKTEEAMKSCQKCEEEIPHSASYCPCCGYATTAIEEEVYVL